VEFEGVGVRADCAAAGGTSNAATPIAASTTFLMFALRQDMEEHSLIGATLPPKRKSQCELAHTLRNVASDFQSGVQ